MSLKLFKDVADVCPQSNSTNYRYRQVTTTRDVTGSNFPNGQINFRWVTSGNEKAVLSKSFLRVRHRLTKADGTTQLAINDFVGWNMNPVSNLFRSCEFRMNSKVVEKIEDFMPQIDALRTRLNKSKSWLDTVGNATSSWQAKVNDRINLVSSDGALTTSTELGYAAIGLGGAVTAAYATNTGVLTFSTNISAIFQSGDIITVTTGSAAGTIRFRVHHTDSGNPGLVMCAMTNGSAATFSATAVSVLKLTRIRRDVSDQVGAYEHIYQPPLSLFREYDGALPASECELVFTPENASTYKRRVIESLGSKTPGTDYEYEIVDMFFYLATIQADASEPSDMTFYLPIDSINLRLEALPTTGTTQNSKFFDVSPSTYAITIAVQDTTAGTTTDKSASKLVSAQSNKVNRLYVDYAAQKLPETEAQPSYKAGSNNEDYMVQRYTENLINTGAYFLEGGAETIQEWRERGAYHYIPFVKSSSNGATRAGCYITFSEATTSSSLMLYSHSKELAECHVRNGQVVDIKVMSC